MSFKDLVLDGWEEEAEEMEETSSKEQELLMSIFLTCNLWNDKR